MIVDVAARLRAAGCVFAEDEARLLISAARGAAELEEMIQRRVDGLPLEQVVGFAEFCGLRVLVDPRVFVPRRRSEFLVWQAAAVTPRGGIAVDLCCGSGALGLALAASAELGELHLADVDPAAVRCASRNVAALGTGDCQVCLGDLYSPLPGTLRGRVDVLLAN
ncbi:MAG TPA: methyltransferase, partial [Streptosporangiaceae bacterium]|nr:methyltransferase [Streptosporangiaceae bacterium]